MIPKDAKKLNKMCQYFHSTDLYDCPKCGKQLRSFQEEVQTKCDSVPLELKQILLDNLKDGKNVGQAIEAVDPDKKYDSIVWLTIIKDQIEYYRNAVFNFTVKQKYDNSKPNN